VGNLLCKAPSRTESSYVVSSANGVKAMKQMEAVKDELQAFEEGIVGISGLFGKKVFIISPKSCFLGDNPCQATISILRGTTSRAKSRKCLKQYNMPLSTLPHHEIRASIYITAIFLRPSAAIAQEMSRVH
jgi:hypothetical protein